MPVTDEPDMDEVIAPSSTPRLAVVLGVLGRVMIITGIVVLLFVVFQLWGTDIQEARSQSDLRDEFNTRLDAAAELIDSAAVDDSGTAPDAPPETSAPPTTAVEAQAVDAEQAEPPSTTVTLPGGYDPDSLALFFPEDGDALAVIGIPAIDVEKVVVRGVAVADLRKGPGHYSQSSMPGTTGNAAIAGHRTTYGKPFNRIDELMPGDEIVTTTVQGEFRYRVLDPLEAFSEELDLVDSIGEGHIIVDPNAAWVLSDFGDDRLTLTACHPKLSSRQRIIVAAELIDNVVEIPDWAVEAEQAQQAAALVELASEDLPAEAPESPPTPSDDTDAGATPLTTAPPPRSAADLDEGLNGERGAIPGAAAWMIAAVAFWFFGGLAGRLWMTGRGGRLGLRFAGLLPAAMCLWFSFEMIDRALPAG